MNNPLICDIHEPTKIKIKLKKLGIPIEVKSLAAGDYQFSSFIVERKTVNDLLNSIYQGRLYNQLYKLMKLEDYKPLLFVIGNIPPNRVWRRRAGGRRYSEVLSYEEQKKKEQLIINNLALAFTSFHIPVYNCKDNNQFVQYLQYMYYRCNKKVKGLKPIKHKQSYNIEDIKSDILTCFPNIGRVKANILAKQYSLQTLANMSIEDLVKIKNISNKMAKIIKDVFST